MEYFRQYPELWLWITPELSGNFLFFGMPYSLTFKKTSKLMTGPRVLAGSTNNILDTFVKAQFP